ncbi:hypothetical protein D3C84_847850 [compost metagenome]
MHRTGAIAPGPGALVGIQIIQPVVHGLGAAQHQVGFALIIGGGETEGLGLIEEVQFAENAPHRRGKAPARHIRRDPAEILGPVRPALGQPLTILPVGLIDQAGAQQGALEGKITGEVQGQAGHAGPPCRRVALSL